MLVSVRDLSHHLLGKKHNEPVPVSKDRDPDDPLLQRLAKNTPFALPFTPHHAGDFGRLDVEVAKKHIFFKLDRKSLRRLACTCHKMRALFWEVFPTRHEHVAVANAYLFCSLKELYPPALDTRQGKKNTKSASLRAKEQTDKAIVELARKCAAAKSVDLNYCPNISDIGLQALAKHLHTVYDLSLIGVRRRSYVNLTEGAILAFAKRHPELKILHLSGCSHLKPEELYAILETCPGIQTLSLGKGFDSNEVIHQIVILGRNIQNLSIEFPDMTDSTVSEISLLAKLTDLTIYGGGTQLTPNALESLRQKSTVKKVALPFCRNNALRNLATKELPFTLATT